MVGISSVYAIHIVVVAKLVYSVLSYKAEFEVCVENYYWLLIPIFGHDYVNTLFYYHTGGPGISSLLP